MVWREARRYGIAMLAVGLALLLARALDRYIAPHVSPPYFLAVMLSAAYAGAGPGILATVLSSMAIAWFDLGTAGQLDLGVDDAVRLAVFIATALIISSISAARKTAERELRVALEHLAAVDRAKDEFIATISHELRTPLTSILGWMRILREPGLDAETRELALDSIQQSATTQAMLVSDMLDASRIVLGKLHVEKHPLFLGEVVREAVAVIRPAAEGRKIALDVNGTDLAIVVSGDRERLKQVVWNLLSNAVKFSPEDSTVRVQISQDQESGIIDVTDEGEGVDPALLPHVFDRFTQGADSMRKGGLGLGLAIVGAIVEQHGGSVTVASEGRNLGSTFSIRIPLLRS